MNEVDIAVARALGTNKGFAGFDINAAICRRDGCGAIAEWMVGAMVWAKGEKHRSFDNCVNLRFPLSVCNPCREKTKISDLVNNQGWRKIVQAVKGHNKIAPDRTSFTLVFEAVPRGRA